jgi:hypothetical protein
LKAPPSTLLVKMGKRSGILDDWYFTGGVIRGSSIIGVKSAGF